MNGLWQTRTWLSTAIVGAGVMSFQLLTAQEITNTLEAAPILDNTAVARHVRKSPVEFFRELLAMTPEEQEQFLSDRSPERRKRIQAKLAEYTALSADERELRLQATELHWYLLPLMKMPVSDRAGRLALIPSDMRKLVEERLQAWDIIPPSLTQELLDNEQVARIFVQSEKVTPADLQKILEAMPRSRREQLEAGILRWQAMPETQRQQICQQFNQFFDLTPQEKEKALNTLPDAERRQMDKTLQEFEKLPRDQRVVCIQSFQKFTDMSLPERELFLRNAEFWKAMSPGERQVWRDLVSQVPNLPPLPPSFAEGAGTNEN